MPGGYRDISLRYVIAAQDMGTKAVERSQERVQKSIRETNDLFRKSSIAAGGAARTHVRSAAQTSRGWSQTSRGAKDANRHVGALGKTAGLTWRKLAGGAAALGGLYALARAGKAAFSEFGQGEKVAAQTQATIRSTGGVANVTAKHIERLTQAQLRKSGVDDETIKTGATMLLTFRNVRNEVGAGNKIFDQATRAVLDMDAHMTHGNVTMESLSKRAIMVGKALNDPVRGATALRRVGVQLTEQQEDQIEKFVESGRVMDAQKIILRELQTEFGGSAKAMGDTFGGGADKARERLLNLGGAIVGRVIPAVNEGLDVFDRFLGFLHRVGQAKGVEARVKVVWEGAKDLGGDLFGFLERQILGETVRQRGVVDIDPGKIVTFREVRRGGLAQQIGNAIADAGGWRQVGGRIGDAISNAIDFSSQQVNRLIGKLAGGLERNKGELGRVGAGLALSVAEKLTDPAVWAENWKAILLLGAGFFGRGAGRLALTLVRPLTRGISSLLTRSIPDALKPFTALGARGFRAIVAPIEEGRSRVAALFKRVFAISAIGAGIRAFTGWVRDRFSDLWGWIRRRAIEAALEAIEPFSHLPSKAGDWARKAKDALRERLESDMTIKLNVRALVTGVDVVSGGVRAAGNAATRRAGGWVPGDPTRDATPALLSGNEFIATAPGQRQAVEAGLAHPQLWDWLAANQAPNFRQGGYVPSFRTGGRYTPVQVGRLARSVGFKGQGLTTAIAVAGAESGFDPNARNVNDGGSIDRGLWQINSVHGAMSTFDPRRNAISAYRISKGGTRWTPWVAYSGPDYRGSDGTWRRFLPAARTAAMQSSTGGVYPGRVVSRITGGGALPGRDEAFTRGFEAGLGGGRAGLLPDLIGATRYERESRRVGGGSLATRAKTGSTGTSRQTRSSATGAAAMRQVIARSRALGLRAGENWATGDPPGPGHVSGSLHYQKFPGTNVGRGVDISGSSSAMRRLFMWAWGTYGTKLNEMFHDPIGWMVNAHRRVSGSIGGHGRHVHVGFRGGGWARRFRTGTRIPDGGGRVPRRPGLPGSGLLGQIGVGAVGSDANKQVAGALRGLSDVIDAASAGLVDRLRARIAAQIARMRRGGTTPAEARGIHRLEAALRLLDARMGEIFGARAAALERIAAGSASAFDLGERATRQYVAGAALAGTDPNAIAVNSQRMQQDNLRMVQRDQQTVVGGIVRLRNQAVQRGAPQAVLAELDQRMGDAIAALDETNTALLEGEVSLMDALRSQAEAAAQSVRDKAQAAVDIASAELGRLTAQQEAGGIADSAQAFEEQASFIRDRIIPAMANAQAAAQQSLNMLLTDEVPDALQADAIQAATLAIIQADTDLANATSQAAAASRQAAQAMIDVAERGVSLANAFMGAIDAFRAAHGLVGGMTPTEAQTLANANFGAGATVYGSLSQGFRDYFTGVTGIASIEQIGNPANLAALERFRTDPNVRGSNELGAFNQVVGYVTEYWRALASGSKDAGTVIKDTPAAVDNFNSAITDAAQAAQELRQKLLGTAAHGVTVAGLQFQKLEAEQRFGGIYDSPAAAQARRRLILEKEIPALEAEALAIQQQLANAAVKDEERQSLVERLLQVQIAILTRSADANEQIAANTDTMVDQLAEHPGSTGFEAFGQQTTDLPTAIGGA